MAEGMLLNPQLRRRHYRVCVLIALLGWKPSQVVQQFHLGPFRIDFALPAPRVAIEVDGPFHSMPKSRFRDQQRDETLKQWGWKVHRIETTDVSDEEISEKLATILAFC